MIIKKNSYAIYNTNNSDGMDICIKDECGRYMLVYVEDVDQLVEDLVYFTSVNQERADPDTPFGML